MSTRLNEFDKDEWRDVARLLCPDWTEEQYEAEWDEFQRAKAAHLRKQGLQ